MSAFASKTHKAPRVREDLMPCYSVAAMKDQRPQRLEQALAGEPMLIATDSKSAVGPKLLTKLQSARSR
jgi:hypothetical protein